jgi:voltage-gated potassium channel Kch
MTNFLIDLVKGKDRYVSLLISLIVLLAAHPIVTELEVQKIYGLLLSAQLIISVYSIGDTKSHLWTAVSLCIPGFALQLVTVMYPTRGTMLLADIAVALFLGYVIVVVYKAVLSEASFSENNIAGAVSVYLLIGVFWAVVYNIVAILQPQSFSDFELLEVGGIVHYAGGADFLYFSFVTLTTLGYGDITPGTPLAHTAAWMEGVAGQLYVAITIATLVSVRVADAMAKGNRKDRSEKDDD